MKIIKGITPAARKLLLYGIHGVGKSTFAASAPSPIFLNLEDGLNNIDCAKTEHLTSFSQVLESLWWLDQNEHEFRTVVIDTADWLEQLIFKDIALAAGVKTVGDIDFGKGYPRAIPMWRQVIDVLDQLRKRKNMGTIILAHSRIEKFNDPSGSAYDRYVPDLWTNARGEGVGNMLQEWVDEVFFACFETYTRKEGKGFNERTIAIGGKTRVLHTSESASSLAKNRLGITEPIPMEWSAYVAHLPKPTKQAEVIGNIGGIVNNGSSKQLEAEAAEAF